MRKLGTSVIKEILILVRDKAGLAIIFIMPMILIFVMALIQDSTFRKMDETSLSVLFIDEDCDSVGFAIAQGLSKSEMIILETTYKGKTLDRETLIRLVTEGKFQIGIIVPPGATEKLTIKAEYLIDKAFEDEDFPVTEPEIEPSAIILYFDPVIKHSFRETMRISLGKLTYGIELKMVFDLFSHKVSELLEIESNRVYDPSGILRLEERNAGVDSDVILYVQVIRNGIGLPGLTQASFSYGNSFPAGAARICEVAVGTPCFEEGVGGMYRIRLAVDESDNTFAGTLMVEDRAGAGTSQVTFDIPAAPVEPEPEPEPVV